MFSVSQPILAKILQNAAATAAQGPARDRRYNNIHISADGDVVYFVTTDGLVISEQTFKVEEQGLHFDFAVALDSISKAVKTFGKSEVLTIAATSALAEITAAGAQVTLPLAEFLERGDYQAAYVSFRDLEHLKVSVAAFDAEYLARLLKIRAPFAKALTNVKVYTVKRSASMLSFDAQYMPGTKSWQADQLSSWRCRAVVMALWSPSDSDAL